MNEIRIGRPYITKKGNTAVIQSDIVENGKEMKLFCQVYEEYEQYLCDERSDAFVVITLPLAIRKGYDIICEAPVTEALLHNINTILIPHLVMGDSRLHPIKVIAPVDNSPIGGEAVGTGISLGVDSMYTIMKYTDPGSVYKDMEITHFMIANNSIDLKTHNEDSIYGWEEKNKASIDRYEEAARYFNKPLIKMYSNLYAYLGRFYYHYTVHTYKTLAHVLLLKKLWRIYYFANSLPFTHFNLKGNSSEDTYTTELLIMHTLNVPDFSVYSSGSISRIQKTVELADYEPARKWLHPCWNQEKKNCSKFYCNKCLRGLLALDYYDKLDAMSEVFDVDYYRKNHFDYLYRLVEKKDDVLLCDLYKMMHEKYPEEMKKAENKYAAAHANISRAKYDELAQTYYLVLKLMSTDNIKEKILKLFLDRGIKTLYCSGGTNLEKTVRRIISDKIQCYDKYTSTKIYECDGAFNFLTNATDIKINTESLKREGAKTVFTVYDLEKLCGDTAK